MRNLWRPAPEHFSPRSKSERGSDIVEAAFVLPIILMLLLGLVVFARGWNIYQTMTRAAREGVRQAVTTSCATCGNSYYSWTDIKNNIVFPVLQTAGIDTSNSVLTTSYADGCTSLDETGDVSGAYITFKYPYTISIPFVPLNIGTVDLQTDVQMRLENQDGSCPPS